MTLRLRATLAAQAELRLGHGKPLHSHRAVLHLSFSSDQGLPLEAWFDMGPADPQCMAAADELACALTAGTEVAVLCSGIELQPISPLARSHAPLRLVGVERVARINHAAAQGAAAAPSTTEKTTC